MPKLSVNLVAFNGEKYLSPCLASVLEQSFRDFSMLMIDNGSHDRTREEIKKWAEIFKKEGIEARTIFLNKNIGFAGGHNLGFKFLISNFQFPMYVCCLNQDIMLRAEFFGKIVEFMDEHSDCGSASGKILRAGDELFKLVRDSSDHSPAAYASGSFGRNDMAGMLEKECKIIDSVGFKIFKSQRVIEKGQGEEDNGQYDRKEEVFGVSGAVPVYRRAALEDVKISQKSKVKSQKLLEEETKTHSASPTRAGGTHPLPLSSGDSFEYFDEDFFSYKEDVDLAYRMRWRGWKSFVIPEAVAYHERTAKHAVKGENDFSAARNRKNKSKFANYHSQRNQLFLLIKSLDRINFSVFWYEFKKFGYELMFEWSVFKAWFDALKKMRVMKEKRRWIMGNRKIEDEGISKWYR